MNHYLAENVIARRSAGGDCLACDREVRSGETVVAVRVRIPILLATTTVEKEMHFGCAQDLGDRLFTLTDGAERRRKKS